MLDLNLIDNTIEELEHDDTNFSNCMKLASLYIIKEHQIKYASEEPSETLEKVQKELEDILPHYETYCRLKTEYQLGNLGKEPVLQALSSVTKEIIEFIQTLYSSTDMPEERMLLQEMIGKLSNT